MHSPKAPPLPLLVLARATMPWDEASRTLFPSSSPHRALGSKPPVYSRGISSSKLPAEQPKVVHSFALSEETNHSLLPHPRGWGRGKFRRARNCNSGWLRKLRQRSHLRAPRGNRDANFSLTLGQAELCISGEEMEAQRGHGCTKSHSKYGSARTLGGSHPHGRKQEPHFPISLSPWREEQGKALRLL